MRRLPPTFSGYPIDDRSGWEPFRAEYERSHRATWERYNAFVVDSGAPPLPDLEFIHESAHLNLSIYPSVADYPRSAAARPLVAPTGVERPRHGRALGDPRRAPRATGIARLSVPRARSDRPTWT